MEENLGLNSLSSNVKQKASNLRRLIFSHAVGAFSAHIFIHITCRDTPIDPFGNFLLAHGA